MKMESITEIFNINTSGCFGDSKKKKKKKKGGNSSTDVSTSKSDSSIKKSKKKKKKGGNSSTDVSTSKSDSSIKKSKKKENKGKNGNKGKKSTESKTPTSKNSSDEKDEESVDMFKVLRKLNAKSEPDGRSKSLKQTPKNTPKSKKGDSESEKEESTKSKKTKKAASDEETRPFMKYLHKYCDDDGEVKTPSKFLSSRTSRRRLYEDCCKPSTGGTMYIRAVENLGGNKRVFEIVGENNTSTRCGNASRTTMCQDTSNRTFYRSQPSYCGATVTKHCRPSRVVYCCPTQPCCRSLEFEDLFGLNPSHFCILVLVLLCGATLYPLC